MSLILRSTKLTRLTIAEMDGNFTYLQDLTLGVSQSIADLHTIPAGGTTSQVLAKASGSDYDLIWVDQTGGSGGGSNGSNGTSGTSGLRGATGSNGTSGVNGADGTNGTSGVNGADGADGTNGTSGVNGADGTNGTSGVNGADGTNGTSGVNGADGTNGTSGVNGADGTNGTSGVNGADGTNGTSGVNGADGADGTNGTSGVNGADGADGTNGTSGVNGADGTNGTSGVNGADGTNGTSGERGPVGSTFNILGIFQDYAGLTQSVGTINSITQPNPYDSYILIDTSHVWVYGPTASMGITPSVANSDGWVDMGAIQGAQGLTGETGTNGTSGTSGIDGTSGANGTNGTNGTSGVNGADGANGTNGTSGVNGTDGLANFESVRNIFTLGTYSPPLGSTQSTGIQELNHSSTVLDAYPVEQDNVSIELSVLNGFLPWEIEFLGVTYSSIYINSNSYITFGTSSQSTLAAPGMVEAPAIFVAAGDNSLQTLLLGFDPLNPDVYRIRFEGSPDKSGFFLGSTIIWEILLDTNSKDQIKIVVGTNLRNPGSVYGISDGTNWVEKFASIPTYDEKTNKMLDSIDIYSRLESSPSYSDNISSIKFVGPGVYRDLSGTSSTINIDPLGQYGLGVNYNTPGFASTNGQTVLSSTRFEFILTTGNDESALRVRPRGDLFLQPYNRNGDQFGNGFNTRLVASNAAQDATNIGDYDGGSIFITPGTGVGAGLNGDVNIGRVGSYIAMTGDVVINNQSGWTGTYSTGAGQVVTVESGIITGVA